MAYYKIDVPGKHGYSFMIETNEKLMYEEDAINLALDNNLFDDEKDALIAVVDDLVTQHDIDHFKTWGCIYQI